MTILLNWQWKENVAKSQRHNYADHNFDFHPAIPLRANGLGRRWARQLAAIGNSIQIIACYILYWRSIDKNQYKVFVTLLTYVSTLDFFCSHIPMFFFFEFFFDDLQMTAQKKVFTIPVSFYLTIKYLVVIFSLHNYKLQPVPARTQRIFVKHISIYTYMKYLLFPNFGLWWLGGTGIH